MRLPQSNFGGSLLQNVLQPAHRLLLGWGHLFSFPFHGSVAPSAHAARLQPASRENMLQNLMKLPHAKQATGWLCGAQETSKI